MLNGSELTIDDVLSAVPPPERDADGGLMDYKGVGIALPDGWHARLDFTIEKCWVLRFFSERGEEVELIVFAALDDEIDWSVTIVDLLIHAQSTCPCH